MKKRLIDLTMKVAGQSRLGRFVTGSLVLICMGLWLSPVCGQEPALETEIQPGAETAAKEAAGPDLEDLKLRLKGVETTELPDETKKQLTALYQQALSAGEQKASLLARAAELAKAIETAPRELETIRAELAKPVEPVKVPQREIAALSPAQLEQRLSQKKAEQAAVEAKLKELDTALKKLQARPKELHDLTASIRKGLDQIEKELEAEAAPEELPQLTEARRIALMMRQQKSRAELAAVQQGLLSHDARLALLTAQRDLAAREAAHLGAEVKGWQDLALTSRKEEAERERRQAEQVRVEARDLPPAVQEVAKSNVELGKQLEQLAAEEKRVATETERTAARLKDLEQDFANAREYLKYGLDETTALLLRRQRRGLPDLRAHKRAAVARREEMRRLNALQLEIDDRLRREADPAAQARELIDSLEKPLPAADREQVTAHARKLLEDRRDLNRKLYESYGRYFKNLGVWDNMELQLVLLSGRFVAFIEDSLLWTRSVAPLNWTTVKSVAATVRQALSSLPSSWRQWARDLGSTAARNPEPWILGFFAGIGLVLVRRPIKRKLGAMAKQVGWAGTDSFGLTLWAVWMTIGLAAGWPLLLAVAGRQLWGSLEASQYTQATGRGMLVVAVVWFTLEGLRAMCVRNGLCHLHFLWPEGVRRQIRRVLFWMMVVTLPLLFVHAALVDYGEELPAIIPGRLVFVLLMILGAGFMAWLFRPNRDPMASVMAGNKEGWLSRTRYLWYPLVVGIPLLMALLSALGFHYGALQLRYRLHYTGVLFLVLLTVHELLMRWLYVTRRRVAFRKAQQRREAARPGDSKPERGAETESPSRVPAEAEIDLQQISEQTRGLLNTMIGMAALLGLWAIWSNVLPAFRFLDDVTVWSYVTEVDGRIERVPITVGKLILAVFVVVVSVIAARRLPSLIEIILLNRLQVDAGARYATITVSRYMILAVGIVTAFGAVGVGWSHVQWLVAALSVGIGFGLQEIVANFISGLIILFERPIRIGDTVTVDTTTGVVSRIQIRATTIVDWDSKEYLVPNKEFVTGRLLNWTLSNSINRLVIPVGVAYGSDTERTRELLLRVAREHPRVIGDPAPQAIFEGFGDNALNFSLRCYLPDIENRLNTINELHMAIERAFREAGIVIAFPQRDVHLDVSGPIRVQVVRDDPAASPSRGDG